MGDGQKSLWRRLWSPSTRLSVGSLLIIGGIGGVTFWLSFDTFLDYSNSMEFCVSCHEMRTIPYEEYKKTTHYQNKDGVRAICSDCHVPKPYWAKLQRKIVATFKELPDKITGKINTPEKYEAHRLAMAERVWATMKSNNSRECRNCHSLEAMTLETQANRAREQHTDAQKTGETCIDCHQGIAHKKPKKKGAAEEPGGFAL